MKELNIAFKEFYSSIRSKRFISLLAFYLFITFFFNYSIKDELITRAGQITVGYTSFPLSGAEGAIAETPISISITGNLMALLVFGAIIGIALGADAINKEIEEGTAKVLMSHPIYKDQVINGKFIGNGMALFLIIMTGYIFSMAYLLLLGIPLDITSILRALIAAIFTLIYMMTFLSIGIMLSTLLKKPETAMLLAIALAIFLTLIYPTIVNVVAEKIVGEEPHCPPSVYRVEKEQPVYEAPFNPCPAMKEWKNRKELWENRLFMLNPTHHYGQLIISAFAGDEVVQNYLPLGESLSIGFNSLAVLLVELLLPFTIAYMRFMTSDLS
ncbi:ABC transporter permease [Thermococcus argininiproducens]|uniref:ABC transporter permease n=1 Tax=Thermococcus argininiproducens TaxID=2866384 RepID=A0A9E7MAB6_9EURY|nr:ABC transporter permease [Thermococcus argininiproducens]USG99943.1 ABC transporter permease [Thermococcus argininiproducens]